MNENYAEASTRLQILVPEIQQAMRDKKWAKALELMTDADRAVSALRIFADWKSTKERNG